MVPFEGNTFYCVFLFIVCDASAYYLVILYCVFHLSIIMALYCPFSVSHLHKNVNKKKSGTNSDNKKPMYSIYLSRIQHLIVFTGDIFFIPLQHLSLEEENIIILCELLVQFFSHTMNSQLFLVFVECLQLVGCTGRYTVKETSES